MKTAIVTGGAGGIGTAIAEKLSETGWRTGVLDLDRVRSEAVASKLRNGCPLSADVTDQVSMTSALKEFGAVPDLLVNNAGIVRHGAFLDQSLDDIRKIIEVNLLGTIVPSWIIGRHMAQRGSGTIINIASIGGTVAALGVGAYGPTKAAVSNFTKLLAVELGPMGVRVNAIAPGLIAVGMGAASTYADSERLDARRKAVPSGRLGTGGDIAEVVSFLASDAASYINGQEILVDGGLSVSLLAQLPGKQSADRSSVENIKDARLARQVSD